MQSWRIILRDIEVKGDAFKDRIAPHGGTSKLILL